MENQLIKIFLIDNDPAFSRFLQDLLVVSEDKDYHWRIQYFTNVEEILYHHNLGPVDVIVLGFSCLDREGLRMITRLNAKFPMVPIMVMTSMDNKNAGIKAVSHGAQDYLIKDQLTAKLFRKSIHYAMTRKNLERVKDEFVSYITHELCTPLSVIREGVSQVAEGVVGGVNHQQKLFLDTSLTNIDRLGRIVEELLDVAKIEFRKIRLEQEEFNIVQLSKELGASYQTTMKKKNLRLKTKFNKNRINVFADKDRITQVFVNLISNAIKFTEKGHIEIAAKEVSGRVECSVTDTGQGIPKEEIPKLFHKFEQVTHQSRLRQKGTGLGLAICKGLVEVHHGKIWVDSQLNKGTKFTFSLPLSCEAVIV